VFLRIIVRGVLVLVPLTVGAARIYVHPSAADQELSRCLGVMRIAAVRRNNHSSIHHGPASSAIGGRDSAIS
jgi:hypothetical protein